MRHNRQTHRLGRNHNERQALLENLVTSLLLHQQIKTTVHKAKAAQRLADRVISLGKRSDSLHARRQVFAYLQDHQLTSRVFREVSPRFKDRQGGYTRILRLDRRKGDGAQMALLELTEKEIKVKEPKKAKKGAKPEKGHEGHKHEGHAHPHEGDPKAEKEAPKHEPKKGGEKQPQKGAFFKNIGKFFRNKGGG